MTKTPGADRVNLWWLDQPILDTGLAHIPGERYNQIWCLRVTDHDVERLGGGGGSG